MEPHVAIGQRKGKSIKIWTSQQVPHNIETELCMAYPELNPGDIEIKDTYIIIENDASVSITDCCFFLNSFIKFLKVNFTVFIKIHLLKKLFYFLQIY